MSTPRVNPISIQNLLGNCWVFALYGLGLGLYIGSMETLKLDLTEAQVLMMEPLSFYAFSILSMVGFLGLGIVNVTTSKTAEAMYSSAWVMKFWVPISNTGLSTGAIVIGMMLGLAAGLLPWVYSDAEEMNFVWLLISVSGFVLALLYPLTVMKRSLFDLTREEEKASVIACILYYLGLSVTFWFIDPILFWRLLSFVIPFFLVAGFIFMKLKKKRV